MEAERAVAQLRFADRAAAEVIYLSGFSTRAQFKPRQYLAVGKTRGTRREMTG
jgi:hypothetical protein